MSGNGNKFRTAVEKHWAKDDNNGKAWHGRKEWSRIKKMLVLGNLIIVIGSIIVVVYTKIENRIQDNINLAKIPKMEEQVNTNSAVLRDVKEDVDELKIRMVDFQERQDDMYSEQCTTGIYVRLLAKKAGLL